MPTLSIYLLLINQLGIPFCLIFELHDVLQIDQFIEMFALKMVIAILKTFFQRPHRRKKPPHSNI